MFANLFAIPWLFREIKACTSWILINDSTIRSLGVNGLYFQTIADLYPDEITIRFFQYKGFI